MINACGLLIIKRLTICTRLSIFGSIDGGAMLLLLSTCSCLSIGAWLNGLAESIWKKCCWQSSLEHWNNVVGETKEIDVLQECIPVGCVPAAHWPYAAVLPGGGVLFGPGGGSAWSGGVLLGPGGGGGLPGPGGGSPWSRGGGSLETPPVNRITDTYKNITFATTSLRPVKNRFVICNFMKLNVTYLQISTKQHSSSLQGSHRSGNSGKSGKILKTFSSQGNQGKWGFQPKSGKKFQIRELNHFQTF